MTSVRIETVFCDGLVNKHKERTFLLTSEASPTLGSAGNESIACIRDLDIGAFLHYDANTTTDGTPLKIQTASIADFKVLFDSQTTEATYIPIIQEAIKYDKQLLKPSLQIGTKPSYFAGTVIKATTSVKDTPFKGVYHIKSIDHNEDNSNTDSPDAKYPGINADHFLQGYQLFVDDYIAIIKDFLIQQDANTLYLVQSPGLNYARYGYQFYNFIFYTIYVVLSTKTFENKLILFNLILMNDIVPTPDIKYLQNRNNFNTMYYNFPLLPAYHTPSTITTSERVSVLKGYPRDKDKPEQRGFYYGTILPYIIKQIDTINPPVSNTDDNDVTNGVTNDVTKDETNGVTNGVTNDEKKQQETKDDKTNPESLPEQLALYVDFYEHMEDWFDDKMLELLFNGLNVTNVDFWVKNVFEGESPSRLKIKHIFNYFRSYKAENPDVKRGGATLEGFKNYIRQKISEIKIKISQ